MEETYAIMHCCRLNCLRPPPLQLLQHFPYITLILSSLWFSRYSLPMQAERRPNKTTSKKPGPLQINYEALKNVTKYENYYKLDI